MTRKLPVQPGQFLHAPNEGVHFKRNADGTTSAEMCSHTATQVTFSYFSFAQALQPVRARVLHEAKMGRSVTVEDVRMLLRGTSLRKAADNLDCKEWIDVFSQANPPRPKATALVFMEEKTGLTRKTLKSLFSRSKNPQKK